MMMMMMMMMITMMMMYDDDDDNDDDDTISFGLRYCSHYLRQYTYKGTGTGLRIINHKISE